MTKNLKVDEELVDDLDADDDEISARAPYLER